MSNCRRVTDANINLSDCSTPREESPLSKRPRKQQQPKKIVSAAEIRVVRRPQKRQRKRHPVDFISRLRDKHISYLIMRKGLRCFWCRSWSEVFPYHTVSSLALHKLWHHRKDKFKCEHCKVTYRHRYQVVLHSSRAHLPREQVTNQPDDNNKIVLQSDEQGNLQNSVPVLITRGDILSSPAAENAQKNPLTDLNEVKIPNFLTSLHELQPSFKQNFPDVFSNSKNHLQDLNKDPKNYLNDISLKNDLPLQDLYKTREAVEELRQVPEVPSNNNTIPQLEMSEKTSVMENPQIQELIDPSSLQGGTGPIVIPSYPPSG